MLSVCSTAVTFAPTWSVFTVLFFMLGLGQIASYVAAFVLGKGYFQFQDTVASDLYFPLWLSACQLFTNIADVFLLTQPSLFYT